MITVNFISFFSVLFWGTFCAIFELFFHSKFSTIFNEIGKVVMGNKHNLAVFPVFALLLRQVESLGLQNHIHGCNEQVQRFKSHWIVP